VTDVVVFHHAQGLTDGIRWFADQLRRAGHRVTVPDLYEGKTFGTLEDGVAYAEQAGFGTIIERGRAAAEGLPSEVVYAGFSLGVLPAQMLAQTRPGARGALLFHSCVPVAEFGGSWPAGTPVQIHAMQADQLFVAEGDLDAARELVKTARDAELFLYPGDRHLFADSSLPGYDEGATALLMQRVLGFLGRADRVIPDPGGGERELLGQYLDFQRQTMLSKTEGLNREQMARRHAPSSLTLAGLLYHLALVEETWMEVRFLGLPEREPWAGIDWAADPEWEFRTSAGMEPAQVRQRYRDACERSRQAASQARGLDQLSVQPLRTGEHFTLGWVLLHLLEETARHAGHADLLREAIDGSVGE
jgi:dienelactone hydrolase